MSPKFSAAHVLKLVHEKGDKEIDEVLMDQDIFSGVGNIIKNEVLYMTHIHPESIVEKIPDVKLKKLVSNIGVFKKLFYKGKRDGNLKEYLGVYKKDTCGKGKEIEVVVNKRLKRKTYVCPDQVLYK